MYLFDNVKNKRWNSTIYKIMFNEYVIYSANPFLS